MTRPQGKDNLGPQELEEAWRILPSSYQREHGPADAFILDFWPPDLRENQPLLFKPHSVQSPRKLAGNHQKEDTSGL